MNNKQKIIVYFYSQTGTLFSLIEQTIQCLKNEYDVIFIPIISNKKYSFPWKWSSFFDVFTDSVLGTKIDLVYEKKDLRPDDIIILGFQPWFLHLSVPFDNFSKTDYFKKISKNRRVVLFSCGRNTCNNALQILRNKVVENTGIIISEIIISDKSAELLSEYRFVRWFFTGNKNPFAKMNNQVINAQLVLKEGLSLRIEWIESISYANELDVCMYAGAIIDKDKNFRSWKETNPNEWVTESYFSIKQDIRLLGNNVISKGVEFLLSLLYKHNFAFEDISYILPHISSMFFFEKLKKELQESGNPIPENKWFMNLPYVGNVGSASIYLMLDELFKSNKICADDKILLLVPESSRFSYSIALLTAIKQ